MRKGVKHQALSALDALALILIVYVPGLVVALWFWLGRILGRIKILHEERMPTPEQVKNMIIAGNHPSVFDPFLLAGLISRYYVLHPFKYAPLIMADKKNFYDSLFLLFFRPVMLPLDRTDKDKRRQATVLLKMAKRRHGPGIIFPEAGRTFKGENGFLYSKKGNDQNGGRIRILQDGLGLLLKKTDDALLLVGIVGSDKVLPNSRGRLWNWKRFNPWAEVTLVIRQPIKFDPKMERGEITQRISAELLNLIDEGIVARP